MSSNFGEEFDIIWPINQPKYTKFGMQLLKNCMDVEKPGKVALKEILDNSASFPIKFPINTCKISNQPDDRKDIIEEQVNSVYPVVHERVIWLLLRFLEHKTQYGTRIEKEVFSNLSLTEFVSRLLSKRAVTFYARNDKYLLINGESGISGFEPIGTDKETPPLLLRNCLSYDEIKLSAFLSVSSYTEFINDGSRRNKGVIETQKNKIENSGIIIGLIGARLCRRDLMEFQDIVISKSQNTIQNGYSPEPITTDDNTVAKKQDYRNMWNEFYEESGKLFSKIKKDGQRYGDSKNKEDIFDNLVMKKRFTISFDTLLLESEARAAESGKQAYIHVVGIGLGAWLTSYQQEEIFLETFSQRLKTLLPKLKHISFVHFSWFNMGECGDIKNGNLLSSSEHPKGGIRVFISKRNPADKLNGPEFQNTLLIVSYAWDGNALPGNEFWKNMLASTGDSSTACSTLVTELHNPHINKKKVSGENLHVASAQFGIVHISEYAKHVLNE